MFDFSKKMPMLDQMIEGLRSFGMLECIKENAELLEPVFGNSTIFSVNAETFIESVCGEFSESGSNAKDVEINIYKFFTDYIEDCEWSGKLYLINRFLSLMPQCRTLYWMILICYSNIVYYHIWI